MNKKVSLKTAVKSHKEKLHPTKSEAIKSQVNVMFSELNGGAGLNPKLKGKFVIPKAKANAKSPSNEFSKQSPLDSTEKVLVQEQPNGYSDRRREHYSSKNEVSKRFRSNGKSNDSNVKAHAKRKKENDGNGSQNRRENQQRGRQRFGRNNRNYDGQRFRAYENGSHNNNRRATNTTAENVNQRQEQPQRQNGYRDHQQQQPETEFQQASQQAQQPLPLLPQSLINMQHLLQNQLSSPFVLPNTANNLNVDQLTLAIGNINSSNSSSPPFRIVKLAKLPNGQWIDGNLFVAGGNLNASSLLSNSAHLLQLLNTNARLGQMLALNGGGVPGSGLNTLNNNNNRLGAMQSLLLGNVNQQPAVNAQSLNSLLAGLPQNSNISNLSANNVGNLSRLQQILRQQQNETVSAASLGRTLALSNHKSHSENTNINSHLLNLLATRIIPKPDVFANAALSSNINQNIAESNQLSQTNATSGGSGDAVNNRLLDLLRSIPLTVRVAPTADGNQ